MNHYKASATSAVANLRTFLLIELLRNNVYDDEGNRRWENKIVVDLKQFVKEVIYLSTAG